MTPLEIWQANRPFPNGAPTKEELAWYLWWGSRTELSTPGWPSHEDVWEAVADVTQRIEEYKMVRVNFFIQDLVGNITDNDN